MVAVAADFVTLVKKVRIRAGPMRVPVALDVKAGGLL